MRRSSALGRLWRRARVLLEVQYAYMLEYRAELIFWMIAGMFPFILMGVWMQAAREGALSMDAIGFGRYFTAVFIVRQLTVVWVIWDFERQVVEGTLSPFLLQPIDPVWRHVAGHVGERIARAPFVLALMAGFFALQPELLFWPGWRPLGIALGMAGLAFALRFAIQYTLAMLCFWTERASAVQDFWFLIYLFLSGLVAPLSEYPEGVRSFAMWTPFPYLVNIPASLLAGLEVEVAPAFGMLMAWLVVVLVLNRVLWTLGLRRYSGMGA